MDLTPAEESTITADDGGSHFQQHEDTSRTNDASHFSDSTSEYNTADLSDLSGLSKILKADDSIADRVRYLLEDDNSVHQDRPALLSGTDDEVPSNRQLKDRMLSLLGNANSAPKQVGDMAAAVRKDSTSPDESQLSYGNADVSELRQTPSNDSDYRRSESSPQMSDEGKTLPPICLDSPDEDEDNKPVVPKEAQSQRESYDDIMNLSDRTEYSDLPKIVDNPIKNIASKDRAPRDMTLRKQNASTKLGTQNVAESTPNVRGHAENGEKISGRAKYYTDSDPNTPHFEEHEAKLMELQRYVQGRDSDTTNAEVTPDPGFKHGSNAASSFARPIHSTPLTFSRPTGDSQHDKIELTSQPSDGLVTVVDLQIPLAEDKFEPPKKVAWEEGYSGDQNITIRSRASDKSLSSYASHPSHPLPDDTTKDIPNVMSEQASDGTKNAPAESSEMGFDIGLNSLKGGEAFEQSLASTVDSLAMQVQSLLQERDSLRNQISSGDLTESFAHDVTQNSNYSEEISNFEKTSLWKYTRQFLPGALTPTREIRPLATFKKPSPAVSRKSEMSMDYSTGGGGMGGTLTLKVRDSTPIGRSSPYDKRRPVARSSPLSKDEHHSSRQYRDSPNRAVDSLSVSRIDPASSPHVNLPTGPSDPPNGTKSGFVSGADMQNRDPPGKSYRFGPPIKYEAPNSQQRIVGRYDSHATVTPLNESYKPLVPEKSQTPFTPYLFVTPKRSERTPHQAGPVLKSQASIESAKKSELSKSTGTFKVPDSRPEPPMKSAYFGGNDVPKSDLERNSMLSSGVTPRCASTTFKAPDSTLNLPIKSAYFGRTSSKCAKELSGKRPNFSDLERKHYQLVEKPIVRPGANTLPKSNPSNDSTVQVRNYSPDPSPRRRGTTTPGSTRYNTGPRHSSPKAVRFKEPDVSKHSEIKSHASPSILALGPEYSFTTPKVSCRPLATRRITPKVVKSRPRSARVLPTYDQLIAEQGNGKDDSIIWHESKDAQRHQGSGAVVDAHGGSALPRETRMKSPVHDGKVPSAATYQQSAGEFSELRPEICFDDSCRDMAVKSLDPSPEQSFASARPNVSESDTELHRRVTSPVRSPDGTGLSVQQSIPSSEMEYRWPGKTDLPKAPYGGVAGGNTKTQHETTPRSSCPESGSSSAEMAPLPHVRPKKRTRVLQPKNSISTEKVQNLLMKEKGAAKQQGGHRSVAVSASLPEGPAESSSSDEDLRSLLETFSAKAPMMEKLLRKLYEKSLQKRGKLSSTLENTALLDERSVVDQSVQTVPQTPSNRIAILRTATTNIPSVARPEKERKKRILVSSASQTSPTVLEDSDFTEEEISPVRDAGVKNGTRLQSQTGPGFLQSDVRKKSVAVKKMQDDEDKENVQRKRTESYAFFVDITPEKPASPMEVAQKANHSPVAWYEPYEYMPPWKQQTNREEPKLGFVKASIQDAFLTKKREFVIRSWERQEDIVIRAEERKLKDLERKIHQQIVSLHREKAVTSMKESPQPTVADPPRKGSRDSTWMEMRMASKKKYECLPEVVSKKRDTERKKYYELNRVRATQYKDRITKVVVQKQKNKKTVQVR